MPAPVFPGDAGLAALAWEQVTGSLVVLLCRVCRAGSDSCRGLSVYTTLLVLLMPNTWLTADLICCTKDKR